MNYKWPSYCYDYLRISAILGYFSSQVVSSDCLIYEYDIKQSPLHLKALIAVLLPFFIWLIMLFILIVTNYGINQLDFGKMFSYFVIISNYMQPFILQQLFDNLKCINLDGKSFLYKEMKTQCDSEDHLAWVFFIIEILFVLN